MKRAWQEDPVYAAEIESAMKVAAVMFDSDEDVYDWEKDFPSDTKADCGLENGCDDDDDDDDDEYEDRTGSPDHRVEANRPAWVR